MNSKGTERRTPTELPRRNKMTHNIENELAKDARMPKTAVKHKVALKAVIRPMRSEPIEIQVSSQSDSDRGEEKRVLMTYTFPSL
jgi:hypothetical protein